MSEGIFSVFQSFVDPWPLFISQDPLLRFVQGGLLLLGSLAVFFVFYTTRDVLLRSRSFFFQILCIALVTVIPFLGFLFYLLIRPSQTLKEREMEEMLRALSAKSRAGSISEI